MNPRNTILTGAIFGFLAVAVGAFGAHALRGILEANGRIETFELATRYQFYHALALLAVAILSDKYPRVLYSGWFFLAGMVLFSGSLYILSLSGVTYWGAVTPLGGISFLAGWMTLGWAAWKQKE